MKLFFDLVIGRFGDVGNLARNFSWPSVLVAAMTALPRSTFTNYMGFGIYRLY